MPSNNMIANVSKCKFKSGVVLSLLDLEVQSIDFGHDMILNVSKCVFVCAI